ncbi:MAG: hypothetical protein HYY30_12580 [Chloroflexi bacterium]|nr:hypothetical protein [Chloroflexota bacterium]
MRGSEKVSFLIFLGRAAASPVERMLAEADQAIALDTIEKALSLDVCQQVIVATNSEEFGRHLASLPVIVELDDEPFHFGGYLRRLIRKHNIRYPFYIGGGSAPLLTATQMAMICEQLLAQDNVVLANNLYSADFVAFTPGEAIDAIRPPETDNDLAYSLHHQAGLPVLATEYSAATQMDVDTPTDLMTLHLHLGVGRHTNELLQGLDLDIDNIAAVVSAMNDPAAQLLVAGRIGSRALKILESETACQTRAFSEERGMRASGREATGRARSLLGFYLESQGADGFVNVLKELGDAALIDSRVIFAHLGLNLTPADRFNSDLLRPEEIENPVAREFTVAVREAPIPVVLGGHSIVAGGLLTLVEAARAMRGLRQRPTENNAAAHAQGAVTVAR